MYEDFEKKQGDLTITRSVRVGTKQWELFGDVCKKNGTDRSKIVRDFIDYYINKDK